MAKLDKIHSTPSEIVEALIQRAEQEDGELAAAFRRLRAKLESLVAEAQGAYAKRLGYRQDNQGRWFKRGASSADPMAPLLAAMDDLDEALQGQDRAWVGEAMADVREHLHLGDAPTSAVARRKLIQAEGFGAPSVVAQISTLSDLLAYLRRLRLETKPAQATEIQAEIIPQLRDLVQGRRDLRRSDSVHRDLGRLEEALARLAQAHTASQLPEDGATELIYRGAWRPVTPVGQIGSRVIKTVYNLVIPSTGTTYQVTRGYIDPTVAGYAAAVQVPASAEVRPLATPQAAALSAKRLRERLTEEIEALFSAAASGASERSVDQQVEVVVMARTRAATKIGQAADELGYELGGLKHDVEAVDRRLLVPSLEAAATAAPRWGEPDTWDYLDRIMKIRLDGAQIEDRKVATDEGTRTAQVLVDPRYPNLVMAPVVRNNAPYGSAPKWIHTWAVYWLPPGTEEVKEAFNGGAIGKRVKAQRSVGWATAAQAADGRAVWAILQAMGGAQNAEAAQEGGEAMWRQVVAGANFDGKETAKDREDFYLSRLRGELNVGWDKYGDKQRLAAVAPAAAPTRARYSDAPYAGGLGLRDRPSVDTGAQILEVMEEMSAMTGESINTALAQEIQEGTFPEDKLPAVLEGMKVWRDVWIKPALKVAAQIRAGEAPEASSWQHDARDRAKAAALKAGNNYYFPGTYLIADAVVAVENEKRKAQILSYLEKGQFPGSEARITIMQGYANGSPCYYLAATLAPQKRERKHPQRYSKVCWPSKEQALEKLAKFVESQFYEDRRIAGYVRDGWGKKPPTEAASDARPASLAETQEVAARQRKQSILLMPAVELKKRAIQWAQEHEGQAMAHGVLGVINILISAEEDPEIQETFRQIPRAKQEEVVGDALVEEGAMPAVWAMSLAQFQNRASGIIYPGWPRHLKEVSVPGVQAFLNEVQANIQAPVKAAEAQLAKTTEGRGFLQAETRGYLKSWETPKGKAAGKAWKVYLAAKDEAQKLAELLHPYKQWAWWMTLRDYRRSKHRTVPAHDETPPPIPQLPGVETAPGAQEAISEIGPEATLAFIEAIKPSVHKRQKVYEKLGSMNKGQRAVLDRMSAAAGRDMEIVLLGATPQPSSVSLTLSDADQRRMALYGHWAKPAQLMALAEGGWISVEVFRDARGALALQERFPNLAQVPFKRLGDGTWWRLDLGERWDAQYAKEAAKEAAEQAAYEAYQELKSQPPKLWPVSWKGRTPAKNPSPPVETAWDVRRFVSSEDRRFGINGIYWGENPHPNKRLPTALVATNGHILAVFGQPFQGATPPRTLLPVRVPEDRAAPIGVDLPQWRAATRELETTGEATSTLAWLREPLSADLLNGIPKIAGEFPDYVQILPTGANPTVGATLPADVLKQFLWQAGISGQNGIPPQTTRVTAEFTEEGLTYTSEKRVVRSLFQFDWHYPADWTGPLHVGLDAHYLGLILMGCDLNAPLHLRLGTMKKGRKGKGRKASPLDPIQLWQEDRNGNPVRYFLLMPKRLD